MLKSSRKKLIAFGCSYTADWNSFSPWPTLLAEMLDMKCVNLGICGCGNDQILAKTVDSALNEKNIGLVVLMWSEWQRENYQKFKDWNVWHHKSFRPNPGDPDWTPKHIKFRTEVLENINHLHATRETFRRFIHAEKFLRDLPYLFIQGCHAIPWYNTLTLQTIDCSKGSPHEHLSWPEANDSRKKTTREVIASPYLDYIENTIGEKFIGWPIMRKIGGYCIDNILDKEDPEREKLRISEDDTHPNGEGHKLIAGVLYDEYKKIYS